MNKISILCFLFLMVLLKVDLFYADSIQYQKEIIYSIFNKEKLLLNQTLSKNENHIEIPTIDNIRYLLNILGECDLLLLDLDDTILLPGKIKYIYPATLIEDNLAETIKNLRDKGIVVLFLTARNPMFSDITEKQLKDLGIKVTDFMEFKAIRHLNDTGLFKNGIIYAPNQEKRCMKGEAFKAFLQKCLFQNNVGDCKLKNVQRVFLVDDLKNNIQQFFSAFCEDHLFNNIYFNGYIFKKPKPISVQIQNTQSFADIFEMCHNLYILAISVIKSFFHPFASLLKNIFGDHS